MMHRVRLAADVAERLRPACDAIAACAEQRDVPAPPPPVDAFALLRLAGALDALGFGTDRPAAAGELSAIRAVARADGGVGRILDGHVNALERLAVQGATDLTERELDLVARAGLVCGVWGAVPQPDEGTPARLVMRGGESVLEGVVTYCSGAGLCARALVLARGDDAGPLSAWVDLTTPGTVEIDARWYRGAGLRSSVSHRVTFRGAPILGLLGEVGAISAQPWFARDALRSAAVWVGVADAAADAAVEVLAAQAPNEARALVAGQIEAERATLDAWLAHAAVAMDTDDDPADAAIYGRVAIAAAARRLLDIAARACGSHPFATAGPLDRARRDLDLLLLQHRLDGPLIRAGVARLRRQG